MKKILEVLQYGDFDIRFNTDIKASETPDIIPDITSRIAIAMSTSLWGGNEREILAIIRALSIADLALSINREDMVSYLDDCSEMLARSFAEARELFEKGGGEVTVFPPHAMPPDIKS